jgi:hypothetical protein
MVKTKTRKTALELITEVITAYPDGYYRIFYVNKGKGWVSLEDHFGGILMGWERELGSINHYINDGFRGIGFEVRDSQGYLITRCADFYIENL